MNTKVFLNGVFLNDKMGQKYSFSHETVKLNNRNKVRMNFQVGRMRPEDHVLGIPALVIYIRLL